jgi:hypothetical protein
VIALVTAVLFVGYTLLYAAVANGGKLAMRPWDALRVDAYSGDTGSPAASSTPSGGGSSIFGKIVGAAKTIIEVTGPVP